MTDLRSLVLALALIAAAPAAAQTAPPAATPTPQPTPTPVPIPPAPVIVLPAAAPTPAPVATPTPTPVPSSRPAPKARPAPDRADPARETPAAPPPSGSSASPVPAPAPAPAPTQTPVVEPPAAAPASVPAAPPPAASSQGFGLWWLVGGLLAALAAAAALVAWCRRSAEAETAEPIEDAPLPAPEPAAAAAPAPAPRARLSLELRPIRAGLNLLSATVQADLTVTNTGDAAAEGVAAHVALTSAQAGEDAALTRFYADPGPRPAAPPFALAPGEARTIGLVAALPREDIHPLTAAGRPMFVPILAVNCLFRSGDGGEGQVTQSFIIGVERPGSAKLAPFWLDQPPRTSDQVAARRNGFGLAR